MHSLVHTRLPSSIYAPPRRLQNRHPALAAVAAPPEADTFDSLAGLLCPDAPDVQLGTTELGRGLVAGRDLPAGHKLLTVDVFSTLCVVDEPLRTGNAFGTAALSDWQSVWGQLPPRLASYLLSSRGDWFRRLVAWLLWLSRHGSGAWQMYTQLLPKESEMCSLMNFTPEERQELQCPDLIALAEQERVGIQGLHDSLFSSSTGDLKALDLAPTLQDTLYACCMVNSRCFSDAAGREALSLMVPLADMANHSSTPNAVYKLDPSTQTFSLMATQGLRAGEEVLISYLGVTPTKSNTELLKDYGFVLPGNINDTLTFQHTGHPEPLLDPALLLEAAAAAATTHGGNSDTSAAATAAQKRRAQAAMRSLQPFVALPGVAGGQPSQLHKHQPSDPTRAQQEMHLIQDLRQQCAEQLARFPTSIATDEQLLSDQSAVQLKPRHAAAVAARLERKRLLVVAQDVLSCYITQRQAADTT